MTKQEIQSLAQDHADKRINNADLLQMENKTRDTAKNQLILDF